MTKTKITREEALNFHLEPTPGKWEVSATVPMTTQRDLSLAYSPGVAVPCEEIAENPELVYDCLLYTSPSPRDLSTSRMPSSA